MKAENDARFRAEDEAGEITLTGTHKLILTVFALAFGVMIYGVIPWSDLGIPFPTWWWWFPEMTASFLLFSIIIGVIGRMREAELTSTFVSGAGDLLGVALIIGIARGITVIMNNGQITDTVLHWVESALGDTGAGVFAVVMFLLFLPLSFLIPSSSGLATVAMPITAPLAGFVDVPESIVVTAYQSASGLMNLFIPTSAVVMGGLAIARVPYGTYLRWVWPLLGALAFSALSCSASRRRSRDASGGRRLMDNGGRWLAVADPGRGRAERRSAWAHTPVARTTTTETRSARTGHPRRGRARSDEGERSHGDDG